VFWGKCGAAQDEPDANFCTNCGALLDRDDTHAETPSDKPAPEPQPNDDEALSSPINGLAGDCTPENDKLQEKHTLHGGRKLIIVLAAVVLVIGAAGLAVGLLRAHSATMAKSAATTEFVFRFSWPKSGLRPTDVITGIRGYIAAVTAPIYLPKQLPAGFYVPRTYKAQLSPADGIVVANPEIWGQPNAPGYGLCFSDGSHQILLYVNAAADVGEGSWVDTGISIGGVPFKQIKGAAFLEANLPDGTKIDIDATDGTLTGEEELQQVLDIARSLVLVSTAA